MIRRWLFWVLEAKLCTVCAHAMSFGSLEIAWTAIAWAGYVAHRVTGSTEKAPDTKMFLHPISWGSAPHSRPVSDQYAL